MRPSKEATSCATGAAPRRNSPQARRCCGESAYPSAAGGLETEPIAMLCDSSVRAARSRTFGERDNYLAGPFVRVPAMSHKHVVDQQDVSGLPIDRRLGGCVRALDSVHIFVRDWGAIAVVGGAREVLLLEQTRH